MVEMKAPCPDCPSHGGHNKNVKPLKLISDCLGVDFQKTDGFKLVTPDISKMGFLGYGIVETQITPILLSGNEGLIRGPPPDWSDVPQTTIPTYLSTQRIRI